MKKHIKRNEKRKEHKQQIDNKREKHIKRNEKTSIKQTTNE